MVKRKKEQFERLAAGFLGENGGMRSFPSVNGVVSEGHLVRDVAFIPFGMAIGEKDVLALVVDLPGFPRVAVGRATHAILGIIILVGVIGFKALSVAG